MRSSIAIAPCICAALLALACGETAEKRETGGAASTITASGIATLSGGESTGEGTMTAAAMTSTSSATGDASVTSPTGSGLTDAVKFDVGEDTGTPLPETGGKTEGCQKIDFLF